MTYNGTFSKFWWKMWQLWWIIDQTTDAGFFYKMIFIIFNFSVLVNCGIYQSRAAISEIFSRKSFDSEPGVTCNSTNMSKFVTIEHGKLLALQYSQLTCNFVPNCSSFFIGELRYELLRCKSWQSHMSRDYMVRYTSFVSSQSSLHDISWHLFSEWH